MTDPDERWILAFDSSCSTCRKLSAVIANACDGKLEVRPLASADVQHWRAQALGPQAPWAPTLLCIGTSVRAWPGKRMALMLGRHLGPRLSVKVLYALGEMREKARSQPVVDVPDQQVRAGMRRGQFLRVAAGAAVVGGLILAGRAPAFANAGTVELRSWLKANAGNLPSTYDEITSYALSYRRAILANSSGAVRSRMWTEQLLRYQQTHPGLTAAQNEVIGSAAAIAASEATFDFELADRSAISARLDALGAAARREFGQSEARTLLATLGTAAATAAPDAAPPCNCSIRSDYCDTRCIGAPFCVCGTSAHGCGTFWAFACNGQCDPEPDCG